MPSSASNGNLRGGKIDMYEGGIKVPTCMVWNNKIESNSALNVTGVTMDFYATLTYLAGIEINHEVDAINLMPDIGDKTIKKMIEPFILSEEPVINIADCVIML